MVGGPGPLQLLLQIGGQLNLEAARQPSFPANQLPYAAVIAILAALNEGAVDLDLAAQQVFPLIPGGVPEGMEESRVEPEFEPAAHIAAQCSILVEIALAQRELKSPKLSFRPECQDAVGEKRLAVARAFAGNQQRAKSAVWKYRWDLGIGQSRWA
jgi:hypothetical protein